MSKWNWKCELRATDLGAGSQVTDAVGMAHKFPLGEHMGSEERLETRIPGNVTIKGVSGKGGL